MFRLLLCASARSAKRQESTFLGKLKALNLVITKRISLLMYTRQRLVFLTHMHLLRTLTHWKEVTIRSAIMDSGVYRLANFMCTYVEKLAFRAISDL